MKEKIVLVPMTRPPVISAFQNTRSLVLSPGFTMLHLPFPRRHVARRAALLFVVILGLMLLPRSGARAQGATGLTGIGLFGGGIVTIGSPVIFGPTHPRFFATEGYLNSGVYYMTMPDGTPFGYYAYLPDTRFIYHFDMGYEGLLDANDAQHGIYLYDFASNSFFYTSPSFPFPYLYDFTLKAVLYYYPDPNHPGRYNTDGVRYFYNFATGQIITK